MNQPMVSTRSSRALSSTCHPNQLGHRISQLDLTNKTDGERYKLIMDEVVRVMAETMTDRPLAREIISAQFRNRNPNPNV